MTRAAIRTNIILDKSAYILKSVENIDMHIKPMQDEATFVADELRVAGIAMFLQRALQALFDMGRHILAKGFGSSELDYKAIARLLVKNTVVRRENLDIAVKMAGYRNRLVHYYDEITPHELYEIAHYQTSDIKIVVNDILTWSSANEDKLDEPLSDPSAV